jgi:hypothetical protein
MGSTHLPFIDANLRFLVSIYLNALQMNSKKPKSERIAEDNKTTFDDLLKRGKKEEKTQPSEEYTTNDPSRSKPENETETGEIDEMGISKKAKRQPKDERDVAKGKK